MTTESAPMTKAEVTRKRIVESALKLFFDRGFDQTTMRLIAEDAGVSVGNAYYYFKSKEELMQANYTALYENFAQDVLPILEQEADFVARLSGTITTWIDTARPYHGFAASFFRNAADPASPLSPFSDESKATRDAMIATFSAVIEGSKRFRVSDDVRNRLPLLLWLFHMGVVLFWVYDQSENQEKSKLLAEKAATIIGQLAGLSRLPVLKGSAKDLMGLMDLLTGEDHTDTRKK